MAKIILSSALALALMFFPEAGFTVPTKRVNKKTTSLKTRKTSQKTKASSSNSKRKRTVRSSSKKKRTYRTSRRRASQSSPQR